jgi:hypothetical protein
MRRPKARDLTAGICIGLMFLGAFILPTTAWGFVLIGGGGLGIIALMVVTLFDRD